MNRDDLELRLARRLGELAPEPTWDFAHRVMTVVASAPQQRAGVAPGFSRRSLVLLLAAALLVGLVAGAVALGTGLIKLPSVVPPSLVADPSTGPGPRAPAATPPAEVGVVAYIQDGRIWVVNSDGTNAHELVSPALDPGLPQYSTSDVQFPIGWSPDGSRLYYRFERVESQACCGPRHVGVAVTDADGTAPVDLLDLKADAGLGAEDAWCPVPADNCVVDYADVTMSADGTRLAYTITEGSDGEVSTVVILDVLSGEIRPLDSTRTRNPEILPHEGPLEPCTEAHLGYNGAPQWSPDGTRLALTRIGCHNAILIVNADGSDLREIAPLVEFQPTVTPRWSPDGSSIVFHSTTYLPGFSKEGNTEARTVDIYTVRPDGSRLRALTTNGASLWPYWTRDGRIVFIRGTAPFDGSGELWIMDSDGGNATQIDDAVPELTAVNCMVCPRPFDGNRWFDAERANQANPNGLDEWFWQP
jgi:Tol biopolymer transport system component